MSSETTNKGSSFKGIFSSVTDMMAGTNSSSMEETQVGVNTGTNGILPIDQYDSKMEIKQSINSTTTDKIVSSYKFINDSTQMHFTSDVDIELRKDNIIRSNDASVCEVKFQDGKIILPKIFSGRIMKFNAEGILVNSITCKHEPFVYMWYDLHRKDIPKTARMFLYDAHNLTREESKNVYIDMYGLDDYDIITDVHASGEPHYSVDKETKILTLYNMQSRYKFMWNGKLTEKVTTVEPMTYTGSIITSDSITEKDRNSTRDSVAHKSLSRDLTDKKSLQEHMWEEIFSHDEEE